MSLHYRHVGHPYLIREAKLIFWEDIHSAGGRKALWNVHVNVLYHRQVSQIIDLDELGLLSSDQKKNVHVYFCLTFIVVESPQREYHFYDGEGRHRAMLSAEETGDFDCFSFNEDREAPRDRTFYATFRKQGCLRHCDVNGAFYPHELGTSSVLQFRPMGYPHLIDRIRLKFQRADGVLPKGRNKVFWHACAEISLINQRAPRLVTLGELGPLTTKQKEDVVLRFCHNFFIVEFPQGIYRFYDEMGVQRASFPAEEIGEFYGFAMHESRDFPLHRAFCASFRKRVRERAFIVRYFNVDGTFFNHEFK